MQGLWRMIAGLLLVTMASALPGAQALAFAAAQPVPLHLHPAGCHGQGSTAPAPAPTSYQCCVNGHHAAIPNASFTIRSMAPQLYRWDSGEGARSDFAVCLNSEKLLALSSSPPGPAPLRI
jgi:hypothetical protein